MEGSIRRHRNRVRITCQLIDAKTDQHLWAETYDQESEGIEILDLQYELALKIAVALKATLTTEEERYLAHKPTKDLDAYDYYLQANAYERKSHYRSELVRAIELYDKAVSIDSSFAQAYAYQCLCHLLMYWQGYDRTEERLSIASKAIKQASALEPNNPVVRTAKGHWYYRIERDYNRALDEFYFAQQIEPGNGMHAENIAIVLRRMGKFEEAVTNWKKALEYNPRSSRLNSHLGWTFIHQGRRDLAKYHYNQAIRLTPGLPYNYISKAWLQVCETDGIDKARRTLAEATQYVDSSEFLWTLAYLDLEDRRYQAALDGFKALNTNVDISEVAYNTKEAMIGRVLTLMGKLDEAQHHFNNARSLLEAKLAENPADPRLHAELGKVYAYLGLKDEGIREGLKAIDLLPMEKDAAVGFVYPRFLAEIYVICGEHDRALDTLEPLKKIPASWVPDMERIGTSFRDPVWDPLREHPRFQAFLENYEE